MQIFIILFLYGIEIVCRLGFSVMIYELFRKVTIVTVDNNLRDAYIIAAFCGLLWLIGQISRHNAYYQVAILIGRIRSSFIFIIYSNLTRISQYTAKTQ